MSVFEVAELGNSINVCNVFLSSLAPGCARVHLIKTDFMWLLLLFLNEALQVAVRIVREWAILARLLSAFDPKINRSFIFVHVEGDMRWR